MEIDRLLGLAVDNNEKLQERGFCQECVGLSISALRAVLNWNRDFLVMWLHTLGASNAQQFHYLLSDRELSSIVTPIDLIDVELPKAKLAPLPYANTDPVTEWLTNLSFTHNPFRPYTPEYSGPLREVMHNNEARTIFCERQEDRRESIKAVINYLHQNQLGLVVALQTPISQPANVELREAVLLAACRNLAELWRVILVKQPELFSYLVPNDQLSLAELFTWAFGSHGMVHLWLRQEGKESNPHGKHLIRILETIGNLHVSATPGETRMRLWLRLRPPRIQVTYLLVRSDTLSDRVIQQVVGLDEVGKELEEDNVILKIWTPPFDTQPFSGLNPINQSWSNEVLEEQFDSRFATALPTGETIARLFNRRTPQPAIRVLKQRFIHEAHGSVVRMYQMGDDLLRQHITSHPQAASQESPDDRDLYLSMSEVEAVLTNWRNRP